MDSYLIHYGVKGHSGKPGGGQWYRNGILTEEGKRHYGIGVGDSVSKGISGGAKSLVEKTSSRQAMDEKQHKNNTFSEKAPKTNNLLNTKKNNTKKDKYTDDDKKKMREHRAKWIGSMAGIGMSMVSQHIINNHGSKDDKLNKIMTKINAASMVVNAISAYHHGVEYNRIKHPERYK